MIMLIHMTCRELTEFLGDYIADTLGEQCRDAFKAHLQECSDCVKYLNSYRRTIELGKEAMAQPSISAAPLELPEGLKHAILAARKDK